MIINEKRALAYTAKIEWIKPIEGADNIELVGVLGWTCIAKIGEFAVGDTCVYFEIDSKLPEADWSAFLANKHYKVKTMKLGKFKVISQGLALPFSAFQNNELDMIQTTLALGADAHIDLTDLLKVTYSVEEDNKRKNDVNPNAKYNSMSARHKNLARKTWWRWLMKRDWGRKLLFFFFGKKRDNPLRFPTHFEFVHKSDEERVENMPWMLGYDKPLIVTEKLDGTSCTYILERKGRKKFEFYVTSRNVRQLDPRQATFHSDTNQMESNIYWDLAIKYDIENHLKDFLMEHPELKYVCIQGEGVGTVQGNPLKLNENQLFVFNFITSDKGRISSLDGKEIIEPWGMQWVPIIATDYMMPDNMEEFKLFADGKSVVNPKCRREGFVLRDPSCDLSFKNVSREYLLKKGE